MALSPYHNFEDQIPQEVKDEVNAAIEEIKNGEEPVEYILDRIDEKLG